MTKQSDIEIEAKKILANLNRGGKLSHAIQEALKDFEAGRSDTYNNIDEFSRA